MILSCTVRNNSCMLLRNFRREKTSGEMWAAVIRTINNLLRLAWLQTRVSQMGTEPELVDAQKGTMKDISARCLKKNIAQVCTCPNCVHIVKRNFNLLPTYCKYCWKTDIQKITVVSLLMYAQNLLITASILFVPSHVQICCVITRGGRSANKFR